MDFKLHRIAVPVALLVPLSAFVYFQLQQDNSASSVELVINDHSDQTPSLISTTASNRNNTLDSVKSHAVSDKVDSADLSATLNSHKESIQSNAISQNNPAVDATAPSFNDNIQQLQQLTKQSSPRSLAGQKTQQADQLIAQTDLLLAGIGLKPPSHQRSRTPSDTDKKQVAATERLLRLQQIQ